MSSLTFVLRGPLQAWGSSSRFQRRGTEGAPTKSGVIGLLAAARGLRRTDPLTELLTLKFGVRIDQPGKLVRDFQTARPESGGSMPLSYRYYLGDAVFLAGIESENETLLEGLAEALENPVFPLYLGRRSCPPVRPLDHQISGQSLSEVLQSTEWKAAEWYQRKEQAETVQLELLIDAEPLVDGVETFRDEPISFDPRRREYGWRDVKRSTVEVLNRHFTGTENPGADDILDHDPMAAF